MARSLVFFVVSGISYEGECPSTNKSVALLRKRSFNLVQYFSY